MRDGRCRGMRDGECGTDEIIPPSSRRHMGLFRLSRTIVTFLHEWDNGTAKRPVSLGNEGLLVFGILSRPVSARP
jgi:hypothetical protein